MTREKAKNFRFGVKKLWRFSSNATMKMLVFNASMTLQWIAVNFGMKVFPLGMLFLKNLR